MGCSPPSEAAWGFLNATLLHWFVGSSAPLTTVEQFVVIDTFTVWQLCNLATCCHLVGALCQIPCQPGGTLQMRCPDLHSETASVLDAGARLGSVCRAWHMLNWLRLADGKGGRRDLVRCERPQPLPSRFLFFISTSRPIAALINVLYGNIRCSATLQNP